MSFGFVRFRSLGILKRALNALAPERERSFLNVRDVSGFETGALERKTIGSKTECFWTFAP